MSGAELKAVVNASKDAFRFFSAVFGELEHIASTVRFER